jgi:hypothetical protein
MNIEEAKAEIQELEKYINLLDNYAADTFEKVAIKNYVLSESVTKVAVLLNDQGFRVGNRKVISKDISDIIREKTTDDLHAMAKKMFNSNKRKSKRSFF